MPTYEYECKSCGHTFDAFQRMSDAPLKVCPECGKELRRLINGGTGIIFKGSGFYVTDAKGGSGASKGSSASPGKKAAGGNQGADGTASGGKNGSNGNNVSAESGAPSKPAAETASGGAKPLPPEKTSVAKG
ncbi:hypothetical protein AGMMS50267_12380 [Spirochaetia bacterium]|nr:hypothetical protein AGMMS50267_12380 [Spirochaetia bacterium]